MIDILAEACRQLTTFPDFWLLSSLGDWSFEEGDRNASFRRYLESWDDPDFPLPRELLCEAGLGINGLLHYMIQQSGVESCVRHQSHGHDIVFRVNGRSFSVEVKYLYDCTQSKYHAAILADRNKHPDYQVVFFLSFPNYRYPAGHRCDSGKLFQARQTTVVGLAAQYRVLRQLLGPSSWPSDRPHSVDLPQGTDIITQDRIRRRFSRICKFDVPWEFSTAKHLRGAQVGFAIWDWSAARRTA